MNDEPYTGSFYVLEGIRPDMTTIPIALGTNKQKLVMLAIELGEKYQSIFVAFGVVFVESNMTRLDAELSKQTHPAPQTRN